MKNKKYIIALFAFSAFSAFANTQTTMVPKVIINAICTMSASNLNFGVINPRDLNTGSTNITIKCSNKVPYTISSNKPYPAGDDTYYLYGQTSGNQDYINYNLNWYSDFRGNGWLPSSMTGTGNGSDQIISLYSRVRANSVKKAPVTDPGKMVRQDNYTDTQTLTITY